MRCKYPSPRISLAVLLVVGWLLGFSGPVKGRERYFLIVFASQSTPKLPRFSHSFGTILRVADPGPGETPVLVDSFTISWMPATLKIHPLTLRPEAGVNLGLKETLTWAKAHCQRVSQWGPYEIEPCAFQRILKHYVRIEKGEYLYKAIDVCRRLHGTSSCIHALSGAETEEGFSPLPLVLYGEDASRFIVRRCLKQGDIVDARTDQFAWLNGALGLDCYPIIHRPLPK
jgi:hypothetical protein